MSEIAKLAIVGMLIAVIGFVGVSILEAALVAVSYR